MAEWLRSGAREVRSRGLARHKMQNDVGQVCLAGALKKASLNINEALYRDFLTDPVLERALGVVDRYLTTHVGYERQVVRLSDIRWRFHVSVEWSNEVAADAEDVAQLLEKAAAWYEETEGLRF